MLDRSATSSATHAPHAPLRQRFYMRVGPTNSVADILIAAILAVLPLLPTGFTYLHRRWPWALEIGFLTAVAAALLYLVVSAVGRRFKRADRATSESIRLVSRGYATWLIPVLLAGIIGILERTPADRVILSIEAKGLLNRLIMQPMHQVADPYYPVRVALTCVEGALAFWVLSAVLRRTNQRGRRIDAAALGAAIGVSFVSLIAVVQYATHSNLMAHWARMNPGLMRANATLDDPNALASFLVLSIGVFAGMAWAADRTRPLWRWIGALSAGLGCLALASTVSRAGWLALVMASIVIVAVMPRRLAEGQPQTRIMKRLAGGALATLTIAVLLWTVATLVLPKRVPTELPKTPWQALVQTVDPRLSVDSILKGRERIWKAAVEFGEEHWTFGAGLGQFPRLYAYYPGSDGAENTHNYFLQTFAECGAAGLAGLVVLLVSIGLAIGVRRGRGTTKAMRLSVGLAIGVSSFVLTWLTGHPMLNLSNQIWLGCMLAIGLNAIEYFDTSVGLTADRPVG